VITPDSLPATCREPAPAAAAARAGGEGSLNVAQIARSLLDADEGDIYRRVHGDVDRILLTEVLERVGGNQVIASQHLGIARSTLRSRISDLGLTIAKRVLPDEAND
jgi:two-component system nitrogen regulation response regulator GlnG